MALFESYERRIDKINGVLAEYGISSIEEAEKITKDAGLNVYDQIKGIQPICFENACWAYTVGAAIAIKKGCKRAADAAAAIGIGLQAFCIPGSVADTRKVGLGHGNLGKMLLEEETECFCFLAGHESFAAAEGAIGIAEKANKVRKKPLRVILNGLGKDAAQIISRINGFTFVETEYDPYKNEVKEVFRKSYSEGLRAKVNCYGAGGQSFGAFIPQGLTLHLYGDSNDYFGKGLSGGKLIVVPPKDSTIKPEDNIIIGNVALYGATSGEVYINGVAGERFAVRNSGAHAVVEGIGDHGLEYMTGGMVIVLGKTGRNFAAGMSGGIAYVYDPDNTFYEHVNKELVEYKNVKSRYDEDQLKEMIQKHYQYTNSNVAKKILDDFGNEVAHFKKVVPHDYKRMMSLISSFEQQGLTNEQAKVEAFNAFKKGM